MYVLVVLLVLLILVVLMVLVVYTNGINVYTNGIIVTNGIPIVLIVPMYIHITSINKFMRYLKYNCIYIYNSYFMILT